MKKIISILIGIIGLIFLPNITSAALNVNQGGTGLSTSSPYTFIMGLNGLRLIASSSPTAGYFTATSTTATSTFPRLSITTGISILGEYFENFTTYVRSLFTAGNGLSVSSGQYSINSTGLSINAPITWDGSKLVATGTPNLTVGYITATSTTATNTFAGGLAVETSGLVYDYSTNRVGIGTAVPVGKLHILGTDAVSASLIFERQSSDIYGPYIQFKKTRASGAAAAVSDYLGGETWLVGNGATFGAGSAIWSYAANVTAGQESAGIDFLTTTDGTITGLRSSDIKVRITNTGNLGIGTTSPYAKLSVVGETVAEKFTATSTTATSTFNWGIKTTAIQTTSTTATSTFARGIDLAGGCYAINGTCIAGTGGSGTVTSVDMSVPSGLTISGNPITTSGTLALGASLANGSIVGMNATGNGFVATGTPQLTVGYLTATSTTATSTFAGDIKIGSDTRNNMLSITPTRNYSNSISTGGALNITNSSNTGVGLEVYSTQASPSGRLVVFNADNTSFNQDVLRVLSNGNNNGIALVHTGTGNNSIGLNITSSGNGDAASFSETGTSTSASALQLTSSNTAESTLSISGVETGRGTIKITHTGGEPSDANAAALSIDLTSTSTQTAAQGIFITSTTGGTTGNLLTLRNPQDIFTVRSTGNVGIWDSGADASLEIVATTTQDILNISSTQATDGDLLTMLSTGFFGIGTTSPNWKLSVAGHISADDYVRASYFTATSTSLYSTFPYADITTSLKIPRGTAPTINAQGQLALDTTSNNLILATSTTGHIVIGSATTSLYAFSIASTSPDAISGGIIYLPDHPLAQVVTGISCFVDGGTSQVINLSNDAGSADTGTATCTTSRTQYPITSNNSYASYGGIRLELGTKTGSWDYLTIRILGYRTTD